MDEPHRGRAVQWFYGFLAHTGRVPALRPCPSWRVSTDVALRPSGLTRPRPTGASAGERAALSVVVEDATKVIDGVKVLDQVSFTARPGRVTALLGPNGAGKSTILRAILGVDRLTSGRTAIGDRPFREHEHP